MIEILGDKSSSEYSAAEQLAEVLTHLWPDIRKSPRELDDVRIRVNCHLTGYKVEEMTSYSVRGFPVEVIQTIWPCKSKGRPPSGCWEKNFG